MTRMMTSAHVVETSVNVTNNSPSRDYSHPDDETTQTTETPGFKPFTINKLNTIRGPSEKRLHFPRVVIRATTKREGYRSPQSVFIFMELNLNVRCSSAFGRSPRFISGSKELTAGSRRNDIDWPG